MNWKIENEIFQHLIFIRYSIFGRFFNIRLEQWTIEYECLNEKKMSLSGHELLFVIDIGLKKHRHSFFMCLMDNIVMPITLSFKHIQEVLVSLCVCVKHEKRENYRNENSIHIPLQLRIYWVRKIKTRGGGNWVIRRKEHSMWKLHISWYSSIAALLFNNIH